MATLTITGTAVDDAIVITASGTDSGTYSINGGPAVEFSGVTRVVVAGEDGNDTLTIVNPSGGLFAPMDGISYDGGGDPADALEVLGGTANDVTYTVGASPDAGTLTYTGGAGTQTIDFAGIAPVTDTVAAPSLTITGTLGADAITVTDGGVVDTFQTTQVGAATFESIRFANKTTVTINGNGGADTLTFNNPTAATGLITFSVANVGAVTQTGAVNYTNLSLDVTGAVTLTGNNDVTNLAAAATGFGAGFSFNDVDDIALTSVGGVNGISTNGAIAITTANGPIIVANTAAAADVSASVSTVALTAGSGATDFFIQLQAGANVTGLLGVQLRADNIDLATGATVNAGTAAATLSGFNTGTLIDLGGADAANTLGVTDSELDGITAGILRIGDAGSGRISFTGAITPAATSQLELTTGADIQDNHLGSTDVAVARLAMSAETGITPSVLLTAVGQIEAQTNTGGLRIDNNGAVTVGGVTDGLTGLRVVTSGDLILSATGAITLADTSSLGIVNGGSSSGNVTLAATSGDVTAAVDNFAISAAAGNISVMATGNILLGTGGINFSNSVASGTGSVNLSAGGNIVVGGASTVVGNVFAGTVGGGATASAVGDIVIQGHGAIGTQGVGNNVTLTAGFNRSVVLADSGLLHSSGDATINADRVVIANTAGISTEAPGHSVTIQPVSSVWAIDLGWANELAASTLALSDPELDRITTGTLRIVNPSNSLPPITISSQITADGHYDTLSLRTGFIVDGTAGQQTDITVANLALQAVNGIGSLDPLDVAVSNLAFSNSGTANVEIRNAAGLTLAAVDGLGSSSNAGGAAQIAASGPLTAATNVTASGVLDLFAHDTAAPGDNLTVLAGATLQSTGDTVRLAGGDDVVVQAGATVQSAGTFFANVDADNAEGFFGGTATLNGTFVAPDTRIGGGLDNDTLNGTPLVDSLEGSLGADTMRGGLGNDTYLVFDAGDVVIENAGEGTDTVRSLVHFTLPANVENLTLIAFSGDLQGYGNALANTITGNEGANILNGGANADVLIGLDGNDVYIVDDAGDTVTESSALGGNDTVFSTAHFALSANVENLVLQGSADLQGYGNGLVNTLYGNTGNNLLDGGTSADFMAGGAGNDNYFVDNAGDAAFESAGEGTDAVFASAHYGLAADVEILILQGTADLQGYGNGQVNTLHGNGGHNLLNGNGGADTMLGGIGNDVYFVDDAGDRALENAAAGNDAVFSTAHFALSANVEILILQGGADLQGYGNASANTLYGNGGNNLLDGGAGADAMYGGVGNDTYFVGDGFDQVSENANEGTDAIFAMVHYILSANVETLVQQGSFNLGGTGNALANSIFGNSGNNTLDGQGNADVLTGNAGNDTFVFNVGQGNGDTIVDFAGNGAAAGDSLRFVGYGAGATFTNIDATHWQVNYNGGASHEIITFMNGASIDASDVVFA